jgi:hypothetical protein
MADARPSESIIEQRIGALQPGPFQRLVESYSRIRLQNVERVVGSGRTSVDATVGPWPDAYAICHDGTQWAIEATHASSGWRSHFRNDLDHFAASRERFAGLLFVSWENGPSDHDVFEELNVDPSLWTAIRVVFRRQLIVELRDPRYAQVWLDPLRLPVSAAPFVPLEHADNLYGREDTVSSSGWLPRRSEYKAGEVHRPMIYDSVLDRLRTERWSFVQGRGAAGKTVLSLQIASDPSFDWSAIYYLDFTWNTSLHDLLDTVVARGDERVLFIVDNAHIAPMYARELFETWESSLSGASLLMLSRVVSTPTRSEQNALSHFDPHALLLNTSADDLSGIFLRLLRRASNGLVERPPEPVLQNWLKLFGGDLLAFSFAVAKRRNGLLAGDLTISAADAGDYVRENYLAEISPDQRLALARLAALAQVELPAHRDILPDIPPRMLLQGVILRETGGDEDQYRFVHAGIGDLVLSVLPEYDSAEIRGQLAKLAPGLAVELASRAETSGDTILAKSLLEHHVAEQTWGDVAVNMTVQTISLLLRLGLITPTEADASFVPKVPTFLSALKATGGSAIASTLTFIERTLPSSYGEIRGALASGRQFDAWRAAISRAEPLVLFLFLRYARPRHKTLFEAIQNELLATHTLRLADDLRDSDLSFVVGFLNFTRVAMAELWKTLQDMLENESDAKRIALGLLRRQLSETTGLLRFSSANMPMLYVETTKLLNNTDHDAELLRKILSDGTNQMAPFFAALREFLPARHEHFLRLIASSPEATTTLLDRAVTGPPLVASHVISFILISMPDLLPELILRFQRDDTVSQVTERLASSNLKAMASFLESVQLIDAEMFKQLRQSLLTGRLAATADATALALPADIEQFLTLLHDEQTDFRFELIRAIDAEKFKSKDRHLQIGVSTSVLKAFESGGRPDLCTLLVAPVVQFADPIRWPKEGFQLLVMGSTLRYTRHLRQTEIDRFLESVVTPRWLAAQYEKAINADILAGGLFDIWTSLTAAQTGRFAIPSLIDRLSREIGILVATPTSTAIGTLFRVMGMLSVYHMPAPPIRFNVSLLVALNDALLELPTSDDYMHFREALFWLGLRSMLSAGRLSGAVQLDKRVLQRAQRLWLSPHPDRSPKLVALFAEMQSWFDACRRAGWRLP